MTQAPSEGSTANLGRGADLFFGDDPEAESAPTAEAATQSTDDEVADVYDKALDDASQPSAVAVEEAEELRQITGESNNGAAPAAAVAALPPPETAAPPPPPPPPPVETTAKSDGGSSRGCLIGIGALLLGALLGAALALAVLFSTNSGLNYASNNQMAELANTAGQLRSDLTALQSATGNTQATLDALAKQQGFLSQNLEALGQIQTTTNERLTAVEAQAAAIDAVKAQLDETAASVTGLESQMTGVSEQVGIVASQLNTVTQQVEEVAVSAQRSDNFLTGLMGLLASLDASNAVTETVVATPTIEARTTITPGEQLTETVAPTTTLTITLTPTIAATATVTTSVEATTVPTATVAPTTTVAPDTTPTPAGAGAIRGTVYFDRDRNGTRDGAVEPGIAGVLVTLYTQDQTEVAQATTNFRGQFEFTGLTPDIYVVVETDPPNFLSSTPNNYTVRIAGATPIPEVSFGDYR